MLKIRFHYLFILLVIALLLLGRAQILICSVTAVILHEAGHAVAAKNRGYVMEKILLMPYGAVLCGGENFTRKDNIIIALSGPLVNLALILICVSLWWLFPESYNYTLTFVEVNTAILLFNLLPAFPLDGARVLTGIFKNRLKALKILRMSGLLISFILLAAFVVTAFYEINYTLGISAVFLAFGALSGTKKEAYVHISKNLPFTKNYNQPLEVKEYSVQAKIQLFKTVRLIKPDTLCVFKIYDGKKLIATVKEDELESLITGFDLKDNFLTVLKKVKRI